MQHKFLATATLLVGLISGAAAPASAQVLNNGLPVSELCFVDHADSASASQWFHNFFLAAQGKLPNSQNIIGQRACRGFITFMKPYADAQAINVDAPLVWDIIPQPINVPGIGTIPWGGPVIGTCDPAIQINPACPAETVPDPQNPAKKTKAVLDLSGLGDCPIMVTEGAQLAFNRLILKVDNVNKAVCKLADSTPITVTQTPDHSMLQWAIFSDVQVVRATSNPITPIWPRNPTIIDPPSIVFDPPVVTIDSDPDNDGVHFRDDNCARTANPDQANFDNDLFGDACDSDDDNDRLPDSADPCPKNPDTACTQTPPGPSFLDADNDGVKDDAGFDNCLGVPNTRQTDTDSDGLGDACDVCPQDPNQSHQTPASCVQPSTNPPPADRDNDGVSDQDEALTFHTDPMDPDTDGDGHCDGSESTGACQAGDNCPLVPNPDQDDADSNGIGDDCENDQDGDGVEDADDNCMFDSNPNQADGDADGRGAACDLSEPPPAASQGSGGCSLSGAGTAKSPIFMGGHFIILMMGIAWMRLKASKY